MDAQVGFSLTEFGNRGPRAASRSFPLKVVSYGVNRGAGLPDTVTGVDLSAADKPTVTVYLRPRKAKEGEQGSGFARPEVVNFATDVLGAAMVANDRKKIEAAMNDPLAKVYTEIGGVLLVDGAYKEKDSELLSASWLKSLAKSEGAAEVMVPVLARLNEPYTAKDAQHPSASMDVVYPEMKADAATFTDLERFAIETMERDSSGSSFVVMRLVNTDDAEVIARMIRPGTKLVGGKYVQDAPDEVMKRFWGSFKPEFVAGLRAAMDAGTVKAEVFPGVRYYFIGKGLEAVMKRGDGHAARFRMAEGEDNGFMASTVVLKAHEGGDGGMFPLGCYPLLPFDAKPKSLATV